MAARGQLTQLIEWGHKIIIGIGFCPGKPFEHNHLPRSDLCRAILLDQCPIATGNR